MNFLNPFNLSTGKNLLFFFTVLQIVLNLETAGHVIVTLVKEGRSAMGFHKAAIVMYTCTGLLTLAILATGVLNLFGIFKNRHKLLIPNLVFTTMLIMPIYLNLIFAIAHPQIDQELLIFAVLHSFDMTAAIITGLMAYKECKEEKAIQMLAKENFSNVATSPEPIY